MRKNSIQITTRPVSDSYSGPNEKRIEFSALREDVLEDGSFNSLMGGLISFTVIRANGADVPEDKLIISVYRTDPNVEVQWRPDDSTKQALPGQPPSLSELADDLDQCVRDILHVDESNDPIDGITRIAQQLRSRG